MTRPIPAPLVEVHGSPFERGRMYGRQAAERIKLGISNYSGLLRLKNMDQAALERAVAEFQPMIDRFDPDYSVEMRGIAEGAGVDYSGIVLLNARTELLKIAEAQDKAAAKVKDDPDGCTAIALLPQATRTGTLIHGQNWDWKAECAETCVVLKVRNEDGPDFLTFTEAGALARSGMNSAGISITGNYLECDRDYRQLGVPLPLIRRKALSSKTVAEAMLAVYSTSKSCSSNMLVCHAGGIAVNFECTPDETFLVHPVDGLVVHANHFLNQAALAKIREKGVMNMPDSLYRDTRVEALAREKFGELDLRAVAKVLLDDYQTPWSVCRPPRPSITSNLSATVATIVMEPASGEMRISILPALDPTFHAYRLEVDHAAMAMGKGAPEPVFA